MINRNNSYENIALRQLYVENLPPNISTYQLINFLNSKIQ
jgi:hypothetical protein